MWLSCQAIIGISVLAGLFRVFANPVTFSNDDFVESEIKRNLIAIAENKLTFWCKIPSDAISEYVNFKIFLPWELQSIPHHNCSSFLA